MPTTIKEIFDAFKIDPINKTKWGECVYCTDPGIYIVSLSSEFEKNIDLIKVPKFDDQKILQWINKVSLFKIDGSRPTIQIINDRLTRFWLPDESILYIGKIKRKTNSGLGKRIHEYYETEIGDGGPHSGGQWIKVLKNLNSLYVYYGYSADPKTIEDKMLTYFNDHVSKQTKSILYDPNKTIPFANIRHHGDKKHGMKKQRL
jgi:hypothetical protein